MVNDVIVEDEDNLDGSDSETSVASEADNDAPSPDLGNEGPHLAPFDTQMSSAAPEKDPVVYSLPARKLLIGDVTDDIPENVKVVRIFTSSTFTGILIKWIKSSFMYNLSYHAVYTVM